MVSWLYVLVQDMIMVGVCGEGNSSSPAGQEAERGKGTKDQV
jgi:hypothetical protein